MNAIDNSTNVDEDFEGTIPETPAVSNVPPSNTVPATSKNENDNDDELAKHAEVVMPFGEYRGKKIFEVLEADADNKALEYFSRLFFKNQAIKGNKAVYGAIFAYYEKNGATDAQKEKLTSIRNSIS